MNVFAFALVVLYFVFADKLVAHIVVYELLVYPRYAKYGMLVYI